MRLYSVPPERRERAMTDDEVYATIFNDGSGWAQFERRLYYLRHDGVRYGAVLATDSPKYNNYALNQNDNDRALSALRNGKVGRMRVIPARPSATGRFEYCGSVDIEELNEKLKNVTPMTGNFGQFWPLAL